jgi:hypothetical protein
MARPISQIRLRELFDYDQDTGNFYRKHAAGNGRYKAGSKCGYIRKDGYYMLSFDGMKEVLAHRCAWIFMNGDIDDEVLIDHIDENRSNAAIKNLRIADQSKNGMNRGAQKNSSTGIKGVSWCKTQQKWTVRVGVNGKYHYGGRFSDIKDAESAAIAMRKKLHKEFANHG